MKRALPYGIILLAVYLISGLIESGYHMMEDHEILANHLRFKQYGLSDYAFRVWNETGNRLSRGLNLYLGIFSAMFGSRWWMWHSLVLTTLSLALNQFRMLGLKFGLPGYVSFILPFVLIVGTPTELMTRLATIESVSLLVAGIMFNRIASGLLGLTTLVLVALLFFTKESFVLLGPFIVAFSFLTTDMNSQRSKLRFFSIGVFVICFVFAAAFFLVDTSNSEADYVLSKPTELLSNVTSYFMHILDQQWVSTTPLPYFGVLFALCMLIYTKKLGSPLFWILIIIGLISILCQFVLLSSVGYSGRYLIPSLIVLIVMFAAGMSRLSEGIPHRGLLAAVVVVLSFQLTVSRNMIDEYVRSGNAIKQMIDFVVDSCRQPCNILLVGDPLINIEMFEAVTTYMTVNSDQEKLSVKILPTEPDLERFSALAEIYDNNAIDRFKRGFQEHYEERVVTSCLTPFDIIVIIGQPIGIEETCPPLKLNDPIFNVGQSWYEFTAFKP